MSATKRLLVRTPGGAISLRLQVRALIVAVVLLGVALCIAIVNLATGDFPLPVAKVLRSLIGLGDPGTDFIVRELRMPRVLVTVLVGVALGASGAVFQSLTRNPLGSPDFVGITVGAATGALVVILILHGSGAAVAGGAIGGCLLAACAIYLLAFRQGAQMFRLVLIGIGVSALLEAFNSWLIVRARLDEALAAQVWLIGSVSGRTWDDVVLIAVAVTVALPLLVGYSRRLSMLSLGDETAIVHGVAVERTRALLALGSVGLAACATAAAGPVAFVALAAPHLAARLAGTTGPRPIPAALMGAVLMTGSDWAAQRVLPNNDIPVGVVTSALGGAYLIWLLGHELRRGRSAGS